MCSSCSSDPVSPFSFPLTASFLLFSLSLFPPLTSGAVWLFILGPVHLRGCMCGCACTWVCEYLCFYVCICACMCLNVFLCLCPLPLNVYVCVCTCVLPCSRAEQVPPCLTHETSLPSPWGTPALARKR